jgi:hypothetical protein
MFQKAIFWILIKKEVENVNKGNQKVNKHAEF